MIGRTNAGFGGGGGGFRLAVGLTAPANPRENTVWVKSTSACRNYLFSGTEPESPSEGMIWFRATSAGIITLADVYTGGAWVAADTYMYLGGSWMQIASAWKGELFENGDQYTSKTGGWNVFVGKLNSADPYLLVGVVGSSHAGISTVNKIDLTEYTTLHVIGCGRGDYSNGSAYAVFFGVATAANGSVFVSKVNLPTGYANENTMPGLAEEKTIDISSLTGEYYIKAYLTNPGAGGNMGIKKAWLT